MDYMIVKRIFDMKKILVGILLCFVLLLTGCSNELKSNPNGVKLYLNDEIIKYMPYEKDVVPFFVFSEGMNLNTIKYSRFTFQEILSGNDDFIVSDAISDLLNEYQDNIYTKIDTQTISSTTRMNRIKIVNGKPKVIKEKLPVDEVFTSDDKKQKVVYDEVAFVLLENGLQLSIEYRRFNSNGKTYYAWRYTRSITLYLHYPLMVYKNEEGKNRLIILPLPNYTKYSVGPQLALKSLIEEDTYLKESYYNFSFEPNRKDDIINFYIERYNGVADNNKITCTYLGIDFIITFDENTFKIAKA